MTELSSEPQPSRIQEKISAGQFAAALVDIDLLLASDPEHSEGLYMAAVCHRYLKQFDKAQTCLNRVKSTPEFSRARMP